MVLSEWSVCEMYRLSLIVLSADYAEVINYLVVKNCSCECHLWKVPEGDCFVPCASDQSFGLVKNSRKEASFALVRVIMYMRGRKIWIHLEAW